MNICFLSHPFSRPGGTKSYISSLALELAQNGHNIHIIAPSGFNDDFKDLGSKIYCHEVRSDKQTFRGAWRIEEFFPLDEAVYSFKLAKFLKTFVKDEKIDIVECPDYLIYAYFFLHGRSTPVSIRLHGYPSIQFGMNHLSLKKWIKESFIWLMLKSQVKRADLVTSVSKFYSDLVKNKWKLPKKEIKITPIGIDLKVYTPGDLDREPQSLLFVGRLHKTKGIHILERSLFPLLNKYPDLKLYLAGYDFKSEEHNKLWVEHLKEQFGQERVIFLGALKPHELVQYYQKATICVCPSLYESGGMIAIEAMACGCPVIVTRQGGFIENIQDNETGLMVPVEDSSALSESISRLFESKELREKISINALHYVQRRFSLELMVQLTTEAYSYTINKFASVTRGK